MTIVHPHIERVVRESYPSIQFLNRLLPSSLLVYQVGIGAQQYILKVAHSFDKNEQQWCRDHLKEEYDMLRHLEDVKGITHLKDYKESGSYPLMLKEYASGFMPHSLDEKMLGKLEVIVDDIHKHKCADLDIELHNLIVNAEGMPTIIDLGGAKYCEKEDRAFTAYKNMDRAKLRTIRLEIDRSMY